jgi:hypothetical protein
MIMQRNRILEPGQTGVTGKDTRRYGPSRTDRKPPDEDKKKKREKIEGLLTEERDSQLQLYGCNFGLRKFRDTLIGYPLTTMEYWQETGWVPLYFPCIDVSKQGFFHDPRIQGQAQWLCEQVAAGRILIPDSFDTFSVDTKTFLLKGTVVLAEKQPYTLSRQIFEEIQREGKSTINMQTGIVFDVWEEKIRPALAEKLRVGLSKVRPKRVIEGFILQFYKKRWNPTGGERDVWEWYLEYLDTPFTRLRGNADSLDCGWYYDSLTAFYPLVEL